jgi:hypothetical protein
MLVHHTKTKGDLGVLAAELDLFEKGFLLLKPQTEHAPFDLVAYRDERFYRVQVKYRAAVNGSIFMKMSTVWNDRHGTHTVPIDPSSIDLLCIYCPDTRACYYLDPKLYRTAVVLRVAPPRNSQQKGIRWAHEFTDIPSTVLGVAPGSRRGLEDPADVGQSSSFKRP